MIEVKDVSQSYGNEEILHKLSFTIEKKSFNVISGESGSGKSTLLSILSTLLKPTYGKVFYDGIAMGDLGNLNKFRNQKIGFIFQFHYLIAHLTVLENILLASGKSRDRAIDLLKELGIESLVNRFPHEISGGQRQRVAIARALINKPQYIFADEPTGNLDSKNSDTVFSLLRGLDATVIVATHDKNRILKSDNIITLKDGYLC